MRRALADFTTYALFALSTFMTMHSAWNYYALTEVVLPSVAALTPTTVEKTNEAIALRITNDTEAHGAKRLLALNAEKMRMLHSSWLAQAEEHTRLARNSLFAWLLAFLASGAVVVYQYRRRKSAL